MLALEKTNKQTKQQQQQQFDEKKQDRQVQVLKYGFLKYLNLKSSYLLQMFQFLFSATKNPNQFSGKNSTKMLVSFIKAYNQCCGVAFGV